MCMSNAFSRPVLIFGASGFIGAHLTWHLKTGGKFTPVNARDLGADLSDPQSIAKALDQAEPCAVINLAAISSVADTEVDRLYAVNAFGWLNLLRELNRSNFSGRVVHASSANIYGDKTFDIINEDRAPAPANQYALSKWLAERFSILEGASLDLVTTRAFNCIGRGQKPNFLVPKMVRHFRQKAATIELGNIAVERDFIDVRDVATAYALLLEAPAPATVVNICTGSVTALSTILDMLRDLTGHHIEVTVNPALIRPNELRHQQGDPRRLQDSGFAPQYTIHDTLAWMLSAPAA